MWTIETWYEQAKKAAAHFDVFALSHELEIRVVADHIGYKCSSTEEFHELRKLFESNAIFVYQSIISKRRIAIIKLITPIETVCGSIYYFELSDQKPDGSQQGGFDHLEFFPLSETVEELVNFLTANQVLVEKAERPHHVTYDISLTPQFKARIESESLIAKIIRDEIKVAV